MSKNEKDQLKLLFYIAGSDLDGAKRYLAQMKADDPATNWMLQMHTTISQILGYLNKLVDDL